MESCVGAPAARAKAKAKAKPAAAATSQPMDTEEVCSLIVKQPDLIPGENPPRRTTQRFNHRSWFLCIYLFTEFYDCGFFSQRTQQYLSRNGISNWFSCFTPATCLISRHLDGFVSFFHSRNLILLLSALTMSWHHVLKLSQKNSLSPQPLLPYSVLSSFPQPYPPLPFLLKFVVLGSSPLSPHFSMFGDAENNDTVWPNLGGRKGG